MSSSPLIRVLSYNVHGLRDDRAALVELIRALAPDVAILQEAPRRLRWRTRCAQLANRCDLLYAAGGLPGLGNLLLVSHRVRVHRTWHVRFPLTPGRHLRGAAFAEVSVPGGRFTLAGSHLATDPAERPEQARLLRRELAAVATPVVLGVDVNETGTGPSWQLLAAGFTDAALAAGHGGAGTFPAVAPDRRIDAVLLDPALTVLGYQVVDSPLAHRASDHRPVVVDLRLP